MSCLKLLRFLNLMGTGSTSFKNTLVYCFVCIRVRINLRMSIAQSRISHGSTSGSTSGSNTGSTTDVQLQVSFYSSKESNLCIDCPKRCGQLVLFLHVLCTTHIPVPSRTARATYNIGHSIYYVSARNSIVQEVDIDNLFISM